MPVSTSDYLYNPHWYNNTNFNYSQPGDALRAYPNFNRQNNFWAGNQFVVPWQVGQRTSTGGPTPFTPHPGLPGGPGGNPGGNPGGGGGGGGTPPGNPGGGGGNGGGGFWNPNWNGLPGGGGNNGLTIPTMPAQQQQPAGLDAPGGGGQWATGGGYPQQQYGGFQPQPQSRGVPGGNFYANQTPAPRTPPTNPGGNGGGGGFGSIDFSGLTQEQLSPLRSALGLDAMQQQLSSIQPFDYDRILNPLQQMQQQVQSNAQYLGGLNPYLDSAFGSLGGGQQQMLQRMGNMNGRFDQFGQQMQQGFANIPQQQFDYDRLLNPLNDLRSQFGGFGTQLGNVHSALGQQGQYLQGLTPFMQGGFNSLAQGISGLGSRMGQGFGGLNSQFGNLSNQFGGFGGQLGGLQDLIRSIPQQQFDYSRILNPLQQGFSGLMNRFGGGGFQTGGGGGFQQGFLPQMSGGTPFSQVTPPVMGGGQPPAMGGQHTPTYGANNGQLPPGLSGVS